MPIFEKNIYDVIPTVDILSKLKVSSVSFIRVIPTGNARNLPDDFFIKKESIIPFLLQVNQARLQYKSIKLSLFGQSFGPNFFSPGVWKYLAGQSNDWPGTKYMCPAINQSYLGVILGTNEIVSCFEGMYFNDQKIEMINKNGKIIINTDNKNRSENVLKEKLRGSCSSSECPYQSLCLGGCRTAAMADAIRRGEPEPEFAGQTICITQILKDEYGPYLK
jgi:radical SAM protein with 4Fe4S-binding SPASM domain